jgi:hypothetical protein
MIMYERCSLPILPSVIREILCDFVNLRPVCPAQASRFRALIPVCPKAARNAPLTISREHACSSPPLRIAFETEENPLLILGASPRRALRWLKCRDPARASAGEPPRTVVNTPPLSASTEIANFGYLAAFGFLPDLSCADEDILCLDIAMDISFASGSR